MWDEWDDEVAASALILVDGARLADAVDDGVWVTVITVSTVGTGMEVDEVIEDDGVEEAVDRTVDVVGVGRRWYV